MQDNYTMHFARIKRNVVVQFYLHEKISIFYSNICTFHTATDAFVKESFLFALTE